MEWLIWEFFVFFALRIWNLLPHLHNNMFHMTMVLQLHNLYIRLNNNIRIRLSALVGEQNIFPTSHRYFVTYCKCEESYIFFLYWNFNINRKRKIKGQDCFQKKAFNLLWYIIYELRVAKKKEKKKKEEELRGFQKYLH